MDLAAPLRSLAPGLDSAVLQVLAGTESALSASQIARLARRGTRVGQIPVLQRLVAHGLVLAEPANHGSLYRLNREHLLAEPVLAFTRVRSTLLHRLSTAVEGLRPRPVHASVFGSFARGEAGPDSDIDLLLVTPPRSRLGDDWEDQVEELATAVMAWTGNRLERVVLSVDRLQHAAHVGEAVVASWVEDSIAVLGPPLPTLLSESASPVSKTRR